MTPKSLNLGKAIVLPPNGEPKAGIVTITNNLATSDTVISIFSNHGDFTRASNCIKMLAPHEICAFMVTFNPTEPGAFSATLTVTSSSAARGAEGHR